MKINCSFDESRKGLISQHLSSFSSMKNNCTISLLKSEDVGKAFPLSSQAGWNQTYPDWIRLLELNPDTCYLFRMGNRVAGSTSLVTYGSDLAWIGMVIVDIAFRGKGIGKRALETLETVVHESRKRGFKCICLTRDRALRGFAFLRPGRQYQHLGPLVAETNVDFADLLNAAARILNEIPEYFDALRRQESSDLLTRHGLHVERRLTRMTLDEPRSVLDSPELHAAVAFEWG